MESMVGEWKLEHRDQNFGEFLECRHVGWFLRTLMTKSSADVEYKLSDDKGTFTKITKSLLHSSEYPMPTQGEFCPLKTLSGKKEFGRLQETSGQNVILEMNYVDSGDPAALVKHKVVDGKLLVSLHCKDIVCNSIYAKK
ncbi:fatty acid-binding protein homolog 9 isoform X2 [Eurytemora carolleeae]|uniref:fatty acid-binding protein homolog 9 isoform X1 n=1 Tax=Eurytemora carolleeae TaxID=1294199 RepID=UPI000C7881F1|nr:fatty acid-binding protein homolog 9 isoform X1 [Eurytemora carolleeae]XP_023332709.1 fatty acid-binding protein homolog 9 isoform X2 [Eurytemora carolleeae]|eukprot:XP_023332708.1 fatty acid-binding protein homolog 9-like isoform X1 [Eurytemora affinis]